MSSPLIYLTRLPAGTEEGQNTDMFRLVSCASSDHPSRHSVWEVIDMFCSWERAEKALTEHVRKQVSYEYFVFSNTDDVQRVIYTKPLIVGSYEHGLTDEQLLRAKGKIRLAGPFHRFVEAINWTNKYCSTHF